MKLLLLICCLPLFATAQSIQRPDDSLRKIADTMHFPSPFAFTQTGHSNLKKAALFNACYAWIESVKDSLQGIQIVKDQSQNKITATNVPATADISCTLTIVVKDKAYSVLLKDYIYHTVNGKQFPVEKAAPMKDFKDPVNIERVLIMHNYQQIFKSLASYLEKK